MVDEGEFQQLTDPYRRELLAHCYRMLGSAHDAEDLLQETMLRAWRGYDGFEGRASLRTWLYKIATSACLSALDSRARRPLPSGLGGPSSEPERPVDPPLTDVAWLQPIPDPLVEDSALDPAAVAVTRSSTRLALIAALQQLPARQRAVLILRDVMQWRAAEVAELLDSSTAAVNSALQRARAHLDDVRLAEDQVSEPTDPRVRAMLERYAVAFERSDVAALTEILCDDVAFEMPPTPTWFAGRDHVIRLLRAQCPAFRGSCRALPVRANGQPAFALYVRDELGVYRGRFLHVLEVEPGGISRVTAFSDDPTMFARFGLPDVHPAEEPLPLPV